MPTRGCAGLAAWATAALQCKVSDHLQTQISLKTLLFPSSCQILSVCRRNSQGWSLTGINPSSQPSDSTAKVTGVRTIHDELRIPAKTLIIWLYAYILVPLAVSANVFSWFWFWFFLVFLETMVPPSEERLTQDIYPDIPVGRNLFPCLFRPK